ncbi:MAG: hypothetical protein MZV65_15275 [Chromatiales bacterium]|nr:hypothetical protein [Chromatiales bacterium]
MTRLTPLAKLRAPLGAQEIELQQIDFDGGGMSLLRTRIREGSRFTVFDIDPHDRAAVGRGAAALGAERSPEELSAGRDATRPLARIDRHRLRAWQGGALPRDHRRDAGGGARRARCPGWPTPAGAACTGSTWRPAAGRWRCCPAARG